MRPSLIAILDTNLWSRIGEEDSASDLAKILQVLDIHVALPPSILLEVVQGSNAQLRNKRIEAMRVAKGKRLSSEAELCSNEFIDLVKRFRPQWMRKIKDASTVDKYHRFWTKEIWEQAHENSCELRERLIAENGSIDDYTYYLQRQNRQDQLLSPLGRDFASARVSARGDENARLFLGGWDGDAVDLWRLQIGDHYWQVAKTKTRYPRTGFYQTFVDWVGSRVDLSEITANPSDFRELWFESAKETDVKRDWLRAAVRFVQTTMKIKKSNSRDEQHSAYLCDADLFLSADTAFIETLESVQSQASFSFAKPVLVKNLKNESTHDAVRRALTDCATENNQ